jgi:hypothetical protein
MLSSRERRKDGVTNGEPGSNLERRWRLRSQAESTAPFSESVTVSVGTVPMRRSHSSGAERGIPMLEALLLAAVGKALVIIIVIIILAIIGAFALIKKVL